MIDYTPGDILLDDNENAYLYLGCYAGAAAQIEDPTGSRIEQGHLYAKLDGFRYPCHIIQQKLLNAISDDKIAKSCIYAKDEKDFKERFFSLNLHPIRQDIKSLYRGKLTRISTEKDDFPWLYRNET